MKKINSNGYAHKIIGVAALFLIGVPFCLYIVGLLFTKVFTPVIYVSLAIGLLIILFFAVLLSIEFCQDKKIDREYANIRKKKLLLEKGGYECQSCGNRQVTSTDKRCGICGMVFEPEN